MEPLYSTTTVITFEEYKKLNKAAFKEQSKLLIIIYSVIIFFAITSKSLGIMLFFLFTAVGSLLLSFYLVKKEYNTNRTLQNQKIYYEFYDTYFLAETSGETTKIYYNELNLIKETKDNFYLSRAEKILYIIIKANCSSCLISFLQNPELKNIVSEQEQTAAEHSSQANSSPSSAVPLYETSTLFNADEQYKLQQYIFIKRWKLPFILIVITVLLIGYALLYENYFAAVLFVLVMASFSITLFKKKGNKSLVKVQEQQLNYRFYENHLQMKNMYGISNFNYKDLYSIAETETNFYLKISAQQHIIIVKANCTPELVNYIRKLRESHK